MKNLKFFTFTNNPYQYTRGVRFLADQVMWGDEFKQIVQQNRGNRRESNQEHFLAKLADELSNFYLQLEELLLIKKDNKEYFNGKLSVKKAWLKNHHKNIFYLLIKKLQNNQGRYNLNKLKELHLNLRNNLTTIKDCTCKIKEFVDLPLERKIRHSEITEHIKILLGRECLIYFKEFLDEIHSAEAYLDLKIKNLKNILKLVEEELRKAEQYYLPLQSSGLEVAKASFNYYTVDKKPKDYYEDKENHIKCKLYGNQEQTHSQNIKENHDMEMNEPAYSIIQKIKNSYKWKFHFQGQKSGLSKGKLHKKQNIFEFRSDLEKEWIKTYCHKYKDSLQGDLQEEDVLFSLNKTYEVMKAFKSEQKSIFYEVIKHITSKKCTTYRVNNHNHLLKGHEIPYKNLNFKNINEMFSLFQFDAPSGYLKNHICKFFHYQHAKNIQPDTVYEYFLCLTKKIQKSQNATEKKLFAKKRGNLLFASSAYFKKYKEFCEFYKSTAQKRGRLLAQIKGLQREKQEARQTGFWSLLYCKQKHQELWLIPKNNRQKAKQFIDNLVNKSKVPPDAEYLCCLESLTMRALNKLCFSEQSSFVEEMPYELKTLQKQAKEFKTNNEQEIKEKSQNKLKFFKKLLKSAYCNKKLNLQNFDLSKVDQATDITEFERFLEEACYYVQKIILTKQKKETFLKDFDVTTLTVNSYDLAERNKNTHQTPVSENKLHTDLWHAFLNSLNNVNAEREVKGFPIGRVRLNPELKIFYRSIDNNLKNYYQTRFPSSFGHRRLKEQITIHFTLSLNSGKKYENLAFSKPEYLAEKIDEFNQQLNYNMDFQKTWRYGVDRGNTELATLCLTKFDPEQNFNLSNGNKALKPVFPEGIKTYTLKDCTLQGCIKCGVLKGEKHKSECLAHTKPHLNKWSYLVKNMSYFVNQQLFKNTGIFEEQKNICCLDLTTAKMISGNIILNGDIMTYLKLKKTEAKRKIYEEYQKHGDLSLEWSQNINGKTEQKRPEGVLNLKTTNKETITVYHYIKKYEGVPIYHITQITDLVEKADILYSKENLKKMFENYINELKNKNTEHIPTVLQINHLRKAVISNMVGVICYLQKTHPGFVIMEDLNEKNIQKHFSGSNANISRGLENALYAKFQSLGLVPPHVKDIIQLREDLRKGQKLKNSNWKESSPHNVRSSQIGAIVFVNEEDTSQMCPYCEATEQKNISKDQRKKEKYEQHRFLCRLCGFDTYFFKSKEDRVSSYQPEVNMAFLKPDFKQLSNLNDPDKVAAYNIAKKIITSDEIGKWDGLIKNSSEKPHNLKNKPVKRQR